MGDLTAPQCIETSMEYMKFCTYVIDKEMKRFNLDSTVYQSFVAQLIGTVDVNFDISYNRCAFMYKYTICNIYFIKDCMNKFLLECTEFKNLISKWTADSNISLCSLSNGPGLDYLSFILALSDHLRPPSFKSVTVLSKHGAWRNTVGIVADALEEGTLSKCGIGQMANFKNIEVVQANLLTSIPTKGFEALKLSSVILMVKTLNLTQPSSNEEVIKPKLLELISSLKPETAIFFIDTKPSLTLFSEVLSKCPGKYLYQPEHFSFRVPVTFSADYKEKHSCFPVVSCRGAFFVWQKLSVFEDDTNFNISTVNPLTDVKEISENSSEKACINSDDLLNITKSLKDLILPDMKNLEPNSVSNVSSDSHINCNMRESESTTSSPVNTSKQFEINKSSSIQSLFPNRSVQEGNSQDNFDDKSSSSHSLKKSTSIDSCFFQESSKRLSFVGESNLLQNYPLNTWRNEETCPTSFPECNATGNKVNENNNALKSNQGIKSTSESKATQTEFHQSIANSSLVKDLTERVKRLVSSLENKVQKSIPNGQTNYHLDEIPNRRTNCSPCATNCSNHSDVDIKPPRCNSYQVVREIPVSCCNHVQINGIHCCAVRHNPIHRCEMHCRSCIHKCHTHPYRSSENNIASTGTISAQPQIVIPLQNISNDILLQIISAAKSGSNLQ